MFNGFGSWLLWLWQPHVLPVGSEGRGLQDEYGPLQTKTGC